MSSDHAAAGKLMRKIPLLFLSAFLASCGTLPQDGPATGAVVSGSNQGGAATYAVVDLTYAVADMVSQPEPLPPGGLRAAPAGLPYDVINYGDTLEISVLEPGGALFGTAATGPGGAPAVSNQSLPKLAVDRTGSIGVPFAGPVRVVGLTPQQAGDAIRRALRGRAINPQVVVHVDESATNGVTVLGAAASPGRLPLAAGADTALDLIAAAGGPSSPPEDVVVAVTRDGQTFETPLVTLLSAPSENIRLAPGDQVNLIARPRRYSTFGALGTVSQVSMPTGAITLTGALGAAGGLDNQSSDARSVFVFRFETPEVARGLGVTVPAARQGVPVIYRLNLADPSGFFIANAFVIKPGDVIYNPRARSAEVRKFFEFVQAMTRVIYDITVTGTLGGIN